MNFNSPVQPRKKSYYYINNHGKLVVLNEDIALEQHNLHKEYLGSSDDLIRTGFNIEKLIIEHFRKYVKNPEMPPDRRRVTNYENKKVAQPQKIDEKEILNFILQNKDKIKSLLEENGLHNQGQKPKIQGNGGETDSPQNGQTPQK